MTSSQEDVDGALTAGIGHAVGAFRYEVDTDRWWWADEVYRMHGFEPGEVVPTTAMILAHKHPDDRERYAGALSSAGLDGGGFASVHRILDANGAERVLATVGEARLSDEGAVVEVTGHFVDVTASVRRLAADEATRQIHESDQHRAVIEQAKGVITARTGMAPDEAFDLLRGASMRSNVKLRDLAGWIVTAAVGRAGDAQATGAGPLPHPTRRPHAD